MAQIGVSMEGVVMDCSIFEEIMKNCSEKKVISRCKKLIKKSELTNMATATALSELAYWLYIYGHEEEAMQVCIVSHIKEPEPNKINYNVWSFILYVWGLEVYIYHKRGEEEKAAERVAAMERIWATPSGVWNTPEIAAAQNKLIRSRLSFDDATYREKVEAAVAEKDKFMANDYRFTALYDLIGNAATGLFPQLEERKDEVEKVITEYMQALR